MTLKRKISFTGFLLVALGSLAYGIVYSFADKIMPYHLEAMGTTWENLSPGMQVMSINFMKSASAGFITTGVAIFFLLLIPFRKGEKWASWALLSVSFTEVFLIGYRTYFVKTLTPANPPLTSSIVLSGIIIVSFFLSLSMSKGVKS